MARIPVTEKISIDENELVEKFVLSTGPGGQNVNKVASAVELRFDIANSSSLPDNVRKRLWSMAGRRATKNGTLVLHGQRFRDQQRNRADVRERLFEMIREASIVPKERRPTRPTRASKERRIEQKKARSRIKVLRSRKDD